MKPYLRVSSRLNRQASSLGLRADNWVASVLLALACAFLSLPLVPFARMAMSQSASQAPPASIRINLDRSLGAIDPRIFGHFTEDVLTSYEGGVLSEMLFNRKFEIQEDRAKHGVPLFSGTGVGWEPIVLDGSVVLLQDHTESYSPAYSQRITRGHGDVPAGIQQGGIRQVMPQISPDQQLPDPFHFQPGEHYRVRLAIKSKDLRGSVHVALGESFQKPVAEHSFPLTGGEGWKIYRCELVPTAEASPGKFMIFIDSPGTVWIDSVSMVRADLDEGGFRKDVLEATRRFKPTSIRWPGGWFVSDYQWQDGIGPIDKRPARLNRGFRGYTNNDVGVDEFIALCRKLGAEPYICVNLGTGTPAEAAALVEYCNGSTDTPWGRLRAANGHPKPYHVKDWNIGNEEFLPTLGGRDGEIYAKDYVAFAKAMRTIDPSIELVGVGQFEVPSNIPPENPARRILRFAFNWNEEMLPIAGPYLSDYSIHYYLNEGDVSGATARSITAGALASDEDLAAKVDRLQQLMDKHAPGGKRFPMAMDEWALRIRGANLPAEVQPRIPEALKGHENQLGLYGSPLVLRDALAEAAVYNLMQRRPHDFALASRTILYAYGMGLLGISGDKVMATPPALMLELYSTYDRCQALQVDVRSPTFDVPPKGLFQGARGAPYLSVSARRHPDGKTVEVFVVNRHLDENLDATLEFQGPAISQTVAVDTLNGASLTEWNSFVEPHRVKLEHAEVALEGNKLRYRFPAHALTRLTARAR